MEDCQFPMTKNFRQSKSRVKKILLTFFDIRGTVHYEFVPDGQTVNQVYYLEVLERLREKVRRKLTTMSSRTLLFVHVCVITFFPPESRSVYEIMWKNIVQLDRPQII